jgi:biotin carboxyl carrier protein
LKYQIILAESEEVLVEVDYIRPTDLNSSKHFFLQYCPAHTTHIATHLGSYHLGAERAGVAVSLALQSNTHKTIKSQMPGRVVKLLCKKGDHVIKGQPLFILEAMKMENEIQAPAQGFIEEVGVTEEQKIESGTLLAVLKIETTGAFTGRECDKKL